MLSELSAAASQAVPGINWPSGGSLLFTISVHGNPDDSPATLRKTAFYRPVSRGNRIPGKDFDSTPPFDTVSPGDEFKHVQGAAFLPY